MNIGTPDVVDIRAQACTNVYQDRTTGEKWHGPYASQGAAIDAILSINRKAHESQCCIRDDRVNAE